MKIHLLTFLLLAAASIKFAVGDTAEDTIFREPFTLNLHIDKERYYEEKFGKIPYVHDDNIYLIKGDDFGLKLDIEADSIHTIKYQADLKKANLTLKFSQEIQADGSAMMLLHIHNNTQYTLTMDGLMTVPGKNGIAKTSILPVRPGLSGFESWSHPIVMLVLRNIQISK